jgi:8-oxo-dGTP pyrophosphatase MutT (NUDIX family)|tara:strand:+ start:2080 stop:2658 length:579 start_codon:yes stop_codon:yes gene_type:complete
MVLSTPAILKQVLAERVKVDITDSDLMPAAVLILLYAKNGSFHVLLNKRSELVEYHKGEISFPGGARDPEDRDFVDTALRETEEEMGVSRGDITILGQLDDIITRTNFGVRVYVGTIPYPYPFNPSADEIAEVLEIPISVLQDPTNLLQDARLVDGELSITISYACDGHVVFGATATILEQFLDIYSQLPLE